MSEVARLRERIEEECRAMKLAMEGFAITASHQMINHRYNSIGEAKKELAAIVGEPEAVRMTIETYIEVIG